MKIHLISTLTKLTLLVLCCSAPRVAFCSLIQEQKFETVKVGEVSVEYPPGLKAQALQLAKTASEKLEPRLAELDRLQRLSSDKKKIARMLCDLLATKDQEKLGRETLQLFQAADELPKVLFRHFRLLRFEEVKAAIQRGEKDSGIPGVSFGKLRGEYATMFFEYRGEGDKPSFDLSRTRWPELVDAAGNFKLDGEPSLEALLLRQFDDMPFLWFVPFHEAAEAMLAFGHKFYHPNARWFNEGVANWAAIAIARQLDPAEGERVRKKLLSSEQSEKLKSNVNLLTWKQENYSKHKASEETDPLVEAHYNYATEAVSRMFEGGPERALRDAIHVLKGLEKPDTDLICRAIKTVTGKDAKEILLDYVPSRVREGLKSGAARRLFESAEALVAAKKWSEARAALTSSLEVDPNSKDAQLLFAFVLEMAGASREDIDRELRVLLGLYRKGERLQLESKEDADWCYLMGRLCMLTGETSQAKDILEYGKRFNSFHTLINEALKEIKNGKPPKREGP